MNLILIQPTEPSLTDAGAVDLDPDDDRATHIIRHLKKKTGDTVSVGYVGSSVDPSSGAGRRCRASVHRREGGGVRLVPIANTMIEARRGPEIALVLAVPFPARLKYLWPVVASFAAVTRVVIVRGRLSDPEFCRSSALKPSVYEPMIERGMSQGGRTRAVTVDVRLEDDAISKESFERLGLLGDGDDGVARIFLDCGDEEGTPPPARDVVLRSCGNVRGIPSAVVAVGPERGWTEEEAKVFVEECGFGSAMLGSSILRVDAAVVSGLAIVSAALDECHGERERENKRKRACST